MESIIELVLRECGFGEVNVPTIPSSDPAGGCVYIICCNIHSRVLTVFSVVTGELADHGDPGEACSGRVYTEKHEMHSTGGVIQTRLFFQFCLHEATARPFAKLILHFTTRIMHVTDINQETGLELIQVPKYRHLPIVTDSRASRHLKQDEQAVQERLARVAIRKFPFFVRDYTIYPVLVPTSDNKYVIRWLSIPREGDTLNFFPLTIFKMH